MEEVQRLLETTRGRGDVTSDRWVPRHAFYAVSLLTGLRRSEMQGLAWGDVHLEEGYLTVRAEVSKAKREDEVPLHPQAAETLRSIRPAEA